MVLCHLGLSDSLGTFVISIFECRFELFLQDVAVKVFSKQEYSDDVILSFRQEVCKLLSLELTNFSAMVCLRAIKCLFFELTSTL